MYKCWTPSHSFCLSRYHHHDDHHWCMHQCCKYLTSSFIDGLTQDYPERKVLIQARIQDFTQGEARFWKGKIIQIRSRLVLNYFFLYFIMMFLGKKDNESGFFLDFILIFLRKREQIWASFFQGVLISPLFCIRLRIDWPLNCPDSTTHLRGQILYR